MRASITKALIGLICTQLFVGVAVGDDRADAPRGPRSTQLPPEHMRASGDDVSARWSDTPEPLQWKLEDVQ